MFYQNYSVEDHPNYSIENVIFSYFMVILLPKKSAYHQQLRILSGKKKKNNNLLDIGKQKCFWLQLNILQSGDAATQKL